MPEGLVNLDGERHGAWCAAGRAFDDWLATISRRRIALCGEPPATYLVQAVQSRAHPIPLVAGEDALLASSSRWRRRRPRGFQKVRVPFYLNGTERHVGDIAGSSTPIPTQIDAGASVGLPATGAVAQTRLRRGRPARAARLGGDCTVTGRDASGQVLFSFSFAKPVALSEHEEVSCIALPDPARLGGGARERRAFGPCWQGHPRQRHAHGYRARYPERLAGRGRSGPPARRL